MEETIKIAFIKNQIVIIINSEFGREEFRISEGSTCMPLSSNKIFEVNKDGELIITNNKKKQKLSEYVYERAAHPDNLYVDEFSKKKEYN